METHQNKLDFSYIGDGIYIGTNQCCRTHFEEALMKDGVKADISLEEMRLDQPFGVEAYLWLPVKDHSAPTEDQLALGVAFLEKLADLKKKVYVHCKNGHGRAPTLVAAYFVKQGKTLEEAEKLLKSKRPSIHFQDAQREALKTWRESLK